MWLAKIYFLNLSINKLSLAVAARKTGDIVESYTPEVGPTNPTHYVGAQRQLCGNHSHAPFSALL
jgi:hypothetical protein